MWFILLLPVFLSSLVISAHFHRAGFFIVAIVCLLLPLILFYRKPFAVWIVQLFLCLSVIEWVRTLLSFIDIYQQNGMSWYRLSWILGIVIAITAGSTLVFRNKILRRRYSMSQV